MVRVTGLPFGVASASFQEMGSSMELLLFISAFWACIGLMVFTASACDPSYCNDILLAVARGIMWPVIFLVKVTDASIRLFF